MMFNAKIRLIQKGVVLSFLLFGVVGAQSNIPKDAFTGDSPWTEIRKERISELLPRAMETASVDAWLVVCRENNNDPLADHVGCENAGSPAAYLFTLNNGNFRSIVYSPSSESTALAELKIHDQVISVDRGKSALASAIRYIKESDFERIAVNTSRNNAQADGLSYTQYQEIAELLGRAYIDRLVSSEELVYEWLSIKLPAEVEIMTKAAKLTAAWQLEAYKQIVPGKTTDADVAKFLKKKMQEYGVGDAWSPDQNPNVNSGPDRGHSHATNKVIMPGDVIQTDFGIRVFDRWVTDIQRFAYVLKQGEIMPPKHIQYYWDSARKGGDAAFRAMKPGVKGIEVDAAQSDVMKQAKSEPVMWSTGHPVGYVAHDTGPNLGGSRGATVRPAAKKTLKEGMVFAFDGFFSWKTEDGNFKTISVEEMAVITKEGAEYLIPPQEDLILIPTTSQTIE